MNWRPALAGVLAVSAISVLGVATLDSTSTVAAPAAAPAPSSTAPAPAAVTPSTAAAISIAIPQIGVQALLGPPVGLNPDGSVQLPDVTTPDIPALYSPGAKPGDPGNAVILGHVDGTLTSGKVELGVFHALAQLQPGAQIKIGRADGSTVTYAVTRVEVVRKTDFPFSAVFGPTTEPWLQLVSCAGRFDPTTKQYLDNLVVFSKLVPTP